MIIMSEEKIRMPTKKDYKHLKLSAGYWLPRHGAYNVLSVLENLAFPSMNERIETTGCVQTDFSMV